MPIAPFRIERYFGRFEFTVRHNLSASDCESMTVEELLELAGRPPSDLLSLRLGYTESQGHPDLRKAISGLYAQAGADDVVVTNAPEEAILVAMETILEPGDRVVVQSPCYQSLEEIARHRGCDVARWSMAETAGGWSADLDALDGLLSEGTKLLVINFPHNPTGIQVDAGAFRRILELASSRGVRVFSDEMYRGVERNDGERLPSACDVLDGAVSLWGTSKSFGLPGLRMGWLVTRDRDLRDAMIATKDYTSICSNAASEVLTRCAVSVADGLFERSRTIIRENLALAGEFMGRHEEIFDWREPDAGPVAFVRLRQGSATAFADEARERSQVLLVPSPIFDFGDSHLRMGLGRKAFPEGLAALEELLRSRR